jgi:hypothetical protein
MIKKRLPAIVAMLLMGLFMGVPGKAYAFEGPLQSRNQFPLFMHADAPAFESARTGNAFTAGFSYSSVFMAKQSAAWDVLLDLEMAMLDLQYRRVVGHDLELGIRVPVINFNSGFMDSFLDDFHQAFNFSDYNRHARPWNEFAYEVRKNGQVLVKGSSGGAGLGDIRLSAKKMLFSGDPAVSIAAGLELPTGDAHKGYGNGSFDADLAIMVDKRWSDRLMAYFNGGVVFPGDIKAEETIRLKESFYAAGGLEYLVTPAFGLIGQLVFQTSPYPETGIGNIDRSGLLVVLGGRYTKQKDSFEFSMTEDLNTAGAPDFTVNFSYKRKF